MVDVDPLCLDAEAEQGVTLGGQVLLIGGASGNARPHQPAPAHLLPQGQAPRPTGRGLRHVDAIDVQRSKGGSVSGRGCVPRIEARHAEGFEVFGVPRHDGHL